jgi:PAS domain S-box-containing protein
MNALLLIAEQSRELVKANILAGYEKPYEAYGLRKNGEVYPLRLEARNIPYKGRDVRVVEFRDITDRVDAEKALCESEEHFRMLASESPVSIVVFDREGQVTFVSDWHLTKFAQSQLGPDFFLGRKVWELPSLVSSGETEKVQRILTGECLHADEVHVPSNCIGKEAYQNMRGVPFRRDGAIVGGVLIREDITERKRADEEKKILNAQLQQAQKMEAIGTLAGGIAHDFNNILGAIVGYSEIIRDDLPPGSPGIHDINQVLKASHRATELVKQILAFSRQLEDQKIPMQPAGIIKETLALLRSSLPTTITIKQEIDSDAGMVLANPTQMHQIVMNLATNAFHAMEVKGGTLTISLQKRTLCQDDLATEPDLQPGTFVQLSIRDSGEGISPEIREKIFDPFFTTKEVGKGTGLGLSMVYSIVKSSGGSIACNSRVGEGTEFRILLPTVEGHTGEEKESTDLIAHGNGHILLIDDEEMLVEFGQLMLERLGYQVTVHTSSLKALATFQSDPHGFDAVITDQTMPGMTGLDLARRMLQIRPELPIILCTGYSKLVDKAEAKAYGIKGFAMKPLTQKEIAVLLREVLTEAARTTPGKEDGSC